MIKVGLVRKNYGAGVVVIPVERRSGSPLANPFYLSNEAERDEVIAKYRRWLWARLKARDKAVITELRRIERLETENPDREIILACWCRCDHAHGRVGKRCHADVIKHCVEWVINYRKAQSVALN